MKSFNSEANCLPSFVKLNIENHMSISKKMLICSILAFPLIANSATVSNKKNASADVEFKQPNNYTHTLKPVVPLSAGSFTNATKIADGIVTSEGNQKEYYALQFPLTTNHASGVTGVEVKGKNNVANKITVSLVKDGQATGTFAPVLISGSDWLAYSAETNILNYDVQMKANSTVVADTYPITVTAAVYTS
jgi:hypothetical protein